MINWPLAADYTMMLQNPQVAFKTAELRQAKITRNNYNQPLGLSGAFAVVYHATLADGRQVAVRAFTSPNSERAERYNAISTYLRQHAKSDYFVDFQYSEKGIRAADGKFYPLLAMEWVSGDTLYDWVQTQCSGSGKGTIRSLTEKWVELAESLEAAKISHGDLQHGNILVCNQLSLKLVDYDCMCVPPLVGRRNLEIGVEPYQHPDRNSDTLLSQELDRFSAIVIFVALRALSADPRLWQTFVRQDEYEKLLFRKSDFEDPGNSRLRQALARSPDADVIRYFESLIDLYRQDIHNVPSLSEFLFSFGTVRTLISKQQYDEAVSLVSRYGNAKDIPPDLRGPFSDAQRRVECRKRLVTHVAAGDERAMMRDYQQDLLENYPAAREISAVARLAANVVPVLEQIEQARNADDPRSLVRIWDSYKSLLASRKCARKLKPEVDGWRSRNQLCDRIQKILAVNNGAEGLQELWSDLRGGGGHPDLNARVAEIELLINRAKAWHVFRQLPTAISQDLDQQRLSAWKESLFSGWKIAETKRNDIVSAGKRLNTAKKIAKLTHAKGSLSVEEQIRDLAAGLPNGYPSRVLERTRIACSRVQVVQQLREAIKTRAGEARLAEAWDELQSLGGVDLLTKRARNRLTLAKKRAPLLAQLQHIPRGVGTQEYDTAILGIWDNRLLNDCIDAEPWLEQYREAVARRDCLERLDAAGVAENDEAVLHWSSRPCLRNYQLSDSHKQLIDDATSRLSISNSLLAALNNGSKQNFRKFFDARLVRKFAGKFEPHREEMVAWTRVEVLSTHGLGLRQTVVRDSVVQIDNSRGTFQIRWMWPSPRITDLCVIGLAHGTPGAGSDPRRTQLLFRDLVYRTAYESAGGCRVIHPGTFHTECQVFIWAVVDLGFTELTSIPVFLGRLGGRA